MRYPVIKERETQERENDTGMHEGEESRAKARALSVSIVKEHTGEINARHMTL